jgi:hypothetical protein
MFYIGLSGVAGSGKDLFFKVLKKELKKLKINSERFALADALKVEINSITFPSYGIDALSCSRKEKESIRDLLVCHGRTKRKMSKGRHWIDRLQHTLDVLRFDEPTVICITDIRYNEHEKDEAYWLKNELGGVLVHISQYEIKETPDKRHWPKTKIGKVFRAPANEEEKRQDPLVKKDADYRVELEYIHGTMEKVEACVAAKVKKFLKWLREHEEKWLEKA